MTVRQCLPSLVCESLSSFSGINLATSTTLYTAAEVRRGEREVVLDIVNKFGCQNSRGVYKLTSFTLSHPTRGILGRACYGTLGREFTILYRGYPLCYLNLLKHSLQQHSKIHPHDGCQILIRCHYVSGWSESP